MTESLPVYTDQQKPSTDWLIDPSPFRVAAYRGADGREIVLTNGLISRTWRLEPNCATVGYENLVTGDSIIRGMKPEAIVTLDTVRYDVGGLVGQEEYAYLRREWIDSFTSNPTAFQFTRYEVGPTVAPFEWKRVRPVRDTAWPPPGVRLTLHFEPPSNAGLEGIEIVVVYEMYDGIPCMGTWFTLTNTSGKAIRVNSFISEILAAVEFDSYVKAPRDPYHPTIHVESDYGSLDLAGNQPRNTTYWVPDPDYTTQVNFDLKTPCLLESRPPRGPNLLVADADSFTTFRTYELLSDTTERERRGLILKRMYRTLAPWCQENPTLMHVRQSDPESVRRAIDQCAEVGFEMVAMTFWSGFDIESEDPEYLDQIRELVQYANSRGVELGGYSLLASRTIDEANDAVNPETGKPGGAVFHDSPCLCSEWGRDYFRKLYSFMEYTGMDLFEHDGSYPGDWCASTEHPDHEGLEDSQWRQWERIRDLYHWCRSRGIFLNVPDWYFFSGSSKTGMGYREVNWSLPRERQILLARQNMYDGTWQKTPTMGWMFIPLVEYHGGGDDATLEPLCDHLDAYEAHLAQNFLNGIQACYRGPRIFDTDETKAVVRRWVDFYKKHRAILESDTIHMRRPDGRDLDCVLHVNPDLDECGLLGVFNPLDVAIDRTLDLPLYYTGLTTEASIRERDDGVSANYELDREHRVQLPVSVPPRGITWFAIQAP
jgi:hypothetical protein